MPIVEIECSPFIRCLQTAAEIAKTVGLTHCKFNYHFTEWLADWLYNENPFPYLSSQTLTPGDLNQQFDLKGISYVETEPMKETVRVCHPESGEHASDRLIQGIAV